MLSTVTVRSDPCISARLIFPGAYGGATSGALFSAAAFAFALGSAGQHASVDVRGLGTLLSFSVHSFLIGWLLDVLVLLVKVLVCFD